MNYTLMPSLEHRALIKTSIMLWNKEDIWSLMADFSFRSLLPIHKKRQWEVAEDKVIQNISTLPLPEYLKKKMSIVTKATGLEILKWRQYHDLNSYLGIHQTNNLCWTPQGTVDSKRTAELLIKEDNNCCLGKSLNITKRYKLACIYCLEDDILELWNKMPANLRKSFYANDGSRNVDEHELVLFWTYSKVEENITMLGGIASRMSSTLERTLHERTPYQCAFEYAVAIGNKTAAEFFLKKLTFMEREESLIRSAGYAAIRRINSRNLVTDLTPTVTNRIPKQSYSEILCFLLSQMGEQQQMEVFRRHPCEVLMCLLDWPWQDLFMETANRMWDILSEKKWKYVLKLITDKVLQGHTEYNYQQLFGEFWKRSPKTHKKYVTDHCAGGYLLFYLFQIEDEENIKLILNDATIIERKKFIFCDRGKAICEYLIDSDKWDLLKFFIRECVSSKHEMKTFKKEFKEEFHAFVERHFNHRFSRRKEKKFFRLIKRFIREFRKRKSEETDDSIPAERLHDTELKHSKKKKKYAE
ncbi:hypothetical protein X975_17661, partial [Stegodyphus mimosarum]